MANKTTLVVTKRETAFRLPDKADVIIATAAEVLPVAWLTLFEPKQVVIPPRAKHLTLFSRLSDAIGRFERRRPALRAIFPALFDDDLDALASALSAAAGSGGGYVQAFLHEAAGSWTEAERERLQGYVRATDGVSLTEWRRLIWPAGFFVGEAADVFEFDPARSVNGLVGWITGREAPSPKPAPPAPEPAQVETAAASTEGGAEATAEAAPPPAAAPPALSPEERKAKEARDFANFLLVVTGVSPSTYRPYVAAESYAEGQGLTHAKFGPGYVVRVASDTRVEAAFQHGKVTLVQGAKG
ncbi:MAG: hypothetical protein U0235_20455 [Polyangiaceae bacterium]